VIFQIYCQRYHNNCHEIKKIGFCDKLQSHQFCHQIRKRGFRDRSMFCIISLNREKIEQQKLVTLPAWDAIMGYQFENLVLNNRQSLYHLLSVPIEDIVYDNPFFQKATKAHRGCQVDLLMQTRYQVLYLIEVKFSVAPIDTEVIEQVQEKMARLDVGNRCFSIRPILVHVNGVTPKLAQSNFFTHLIDFGQLLETRVGQIW
jgi:hypothetical protein